MSKLESDANEQKGSAAPQSGMREALTREQIEKWRGWLMDTHTGADRVQLSWLCDMALLPLGEREAVIEECARICEVRAEELDGLIEKAKRGGPSQPGYVRDATWHGWIGARNALHNEAAAIRALSARTHEQQQEAK